MNVRLERQNYLHYLSMLMSLINFLILVFFTAIMDITLRNVNNNNAARSFLENITYLPMEPVCTTILTFLSFFTLLGIIRIKSMMENDRIKTIALTIIEIALCLLIMKCLYVGYNGILLLVIADIVVYIRDKQNQGVFLLIMSLIYISSDYDMISIGCKIISFRDFLHIYASDFRLFLIGIRNILVSMNLMVFIVYIIILMRDQMREKGKAVLLNVELQVAEEMNEQLRDYAKVQKQLGETEERNRIAREIHDTLGHTMTGLSAGIDACIAMIDYSTEATKQQLIVISRVARQGLLDIRRSMNKLRPDTLEKRTLEEAIQKLINDTMQMSDVSIQYQSTLDSMSFKSDEEDTIFRIVQESITNAVRHGKASYISISMQKAGKWLVIRINDNGKGCQEIHSGFGLTHMRERVQMLHGVVSFDGSHGFKTLVMIPIRWREDYD
ncbi:MAG: sensor histidine kinase [Lachnospiraceae bacterium]|nr:sensor histidine kinase [Lachnospiraceae bacterium]